ncbi:hypothetical protein U91I_01260 [alpha proteobacterium U9-1i]|nr:hypothetical protein U91I_01260 [alpha proteobacterium U9-1i]
MDIRAFDLGDLEALQAIRAAAFAPVFTSFREIVGADIAGIALCNSEAEQAVLLEEIAKPNSGHELWVAVAEGAVIGFVSLKVDASVGELGLNAVRPDQTNHGVGGALYAYALMRMKALGASVATVGVGGDASHAAARRAYEKAGFGPAIPSLYMYRKL